MSKPKSERNESNLEFFHNYYKLDREITELLIRNFGVKDLDYPVWLLDYYKNEVLKTLANCLSNITHANTVYATTEQEYYFRRQYQWNAIGDLEYLLQIMQRATEDLSVKCQTKIFAEKEEGLESF